VFASGDTGSESLYAPDEIVAESIIWKPFGVNEEDINKA
jgi:hypothetical protein